MEENLREGCSLEKGKHFQSVCSRTIFLWKIPYLKVVGFRWRERRVDLRKLRVTTCSLKSMAPIAWYCFFGGGQSHEGVGMRWEEGLLTERMSGGVGVIVEKCFSSIE